jgi:dihydrodipicolinate synthase/N-acetylneuraminate lyase
MSKNFNGIIPPVITCFTKDGKIDGAAQRKIICFQAKYVYGFIRMAPAVVVRS